MKNNNKNYVPRNLRVVTVPNRNFFAFVNQHFFNNSNVIGTKTFPVFLSVLSIQKHDNGTVHQCTFFYSPFYERRLLVGRWQFYKHFFRAHLPLRSAARYCNINSTCPTGNGDDDDEENAVSIEKISIRTGQYLENASVNGK